MMSSLNGKDMVDMMAAGVETFVKDHLLENIVSNLVDEFKKEITNVVSDELAEMSFKAHSQDNHLEFRKELYLIIEWVKTQKAFKSKYEMKKEIEES